MASRHCVVHLGMVVFLVVLHSAVRAGELCFDLASATGAAAERPGESNGLEAELKEDDKIEYLDAAGLEKLAANRWLHDRFAPLVESLPAGGRLQLVYRNHPTHAGVRRDLYRTTQLDAQGRAHGRVTYYVLSYTKKPVREVPYVEGVVHGVEKQYEGDVLRAEIPWQRGRLTGVRKTYYRCGQLLAETPCTGGEPDGMVVSYSPKGVVTRRSEMKSGKRHGTTTDYWPETGKPKRTLQYAQGQVVGVMREYYADGALKREVPFRDNAMHGTEKQYEQDGALARRREWRDGELVSEKTAPVEG